MCEIVGKKNDKQSLVFYERSMCRTDDCDSSFVLCRVQVSWSTHVGLGHFVFWLQSDRWYQPSPSRWSEICSFIPHGFTQAVSLLAFLFLFNAQPTVIVVSCHCRISDQLLYWQSLLFCDLVTVWDPSSHFCDLWAVLPILILYVIFLFKLIGSFEYSFRTPQMYIYPVFHQKNCTSENKND